MLIIMKEQHLQYHSLIPRFSSVDLHFQNLVNHDHL